MQETLVRSLGQENPLEEETLLVWKNPMDRRAWQATVHGVKESDTAEHPRMLLSGGRLQGERSSRETPPWATAVQREMTDQVYLGGGIIMTC